MSYCLGIQGLGVLSGKPVAKGVEGLGLRGLGFRVWCLGV